MSVGGPVVERGFGQREDDQRGEPSMTSLPAVSRGHE
jgi:hypothetical protein